MDKDNYIQKLLGLLYEARRLNNKTVLNSVEVEKWHRAVDEELRNTDNPFYQSPDEEYDAPKRVAHRKWIREIYK